MKLTVSDFIRSQWTAVPPVAHADLTGKTVIVTGANNGIGFEATKHFARMNPGKLILACRSKERGQTALDGECNIHGNTGEDDTNQLLDPVELKEATGCKTAELWILDLASFESVKAFANKFNKEAGRLDILVNNAAVTPSEPVRTTSDGWEETSVLSYICNTCTVILY